MILDLLEDDFVFIPDFNENKKLPKDEQIRVHIKRPTLRERSSLQKVCVSRDDLYEVIVDHERTVIEHVPLIQNLKIGKEDISTGAQLVSKKAKGRDKLVVEIANLGVLPPEGE